MSRGRLTVTIKEQITKGLIEHRFNGIKLNLKNSWEQLFSDTYQACFSKEDHLIMASLPKGWLEERSYILIKFGERIHRLYSKDREVKLPSNRTHSVVSIFDLDHELSITYFRLKSEEEALKKEQSLAQAKIENTLNQYCTIKRLVEAWPEVKPFIKQEEMKPHLPAIRMDDLNLSLNLPLNRLDEKLSSKISGINKEEDDD